MMEYHRHLRYADQDNESWYTHRHEGSEKPHYHDEVREGTIVGLGVAEETNVGRREVKSG